MLKDKLFCPVRTDEFYCHQMVVKANHLDGFKADSKELVSVHLPMAVNHRVFVEPPMFRGCMVLTMGASSTRLFLLTLVGIRLVPVRFEMLK